MKNESVLWKFYYPHESRIHYLLGTMHVSSELAYSSVSKAKLCMEQCAIFAGELDLDDARIATLSELYKNPDSLDLVDLIGEKKYRKYHKVIANAFGIDIDILSHFKPLIITNMIAESVVSKDYDLSLDYFLWQYALSQNMQMHGLESFDEQKRILLDIPMEVQLKSLKDLVKNISKFRKSILKIQSQYANGELTKLYKSTKKSLGPIRKLMIYDRNKIMTDRLVNLAQEGAIFSAVGAGHLPGKKGMLNLLKKAGFICKPIQF